MSIIFFQFKYERVIENFLLPNIGYRRLIGTTAEAKEKRAATKTTIIEISSKAR